MKINVKILLLVFGLFTQSITKCSLRLSKLAGSNNSFNGLTPDSTPTKSNRNRIIQAIRRYEELKETSKGPNKEIQVVQPDGRQPQSGTPVKSKGLSGLFNSFRSDWKQEFYDRVGRDGLGFIYRGIDQYTMQAHIDCFIDRTNLRVVKKQSENSIRWFAAVTVRQVEPGKYQTDIEMPNVPYFADVNGTQFLPGQSVSYISDTLPESHLIARLSPLHAIYGE